MTKTLRMVNISQATLHDTIASLLYALGAVDDDKEIINLFICDYPPDQPDILVSVVFEERKNES